MKVAYYNNHALFQTNLIKKVLIKEKFNRKNYSKF